MPLTWCLIVLQKILKPSNPSNIRLMSVWSPSTDSWECKNTMNPFHIHLTIRGRINSGANIRSTAIPLSSTECSREFPFHLRLTFVQRIMVHLTCIRLTSWSGIWNGLYPFGYPLDGLKQTSPFCNLQQHMSRGNHYPTTPTAKTGERESYLEAYNIYIWSPLILWRRDSILHLLLRSF